MGNKIRNSDHIRCRRTHMRFAIIESTQKGSGPNKMQIMEISYKLNKFNIVLEGVKNQPAWWH